MAQYALIRNGMGSYTAGTGAKEDDLLHMGNFYLLSSGIVDSTDLLVSENGSGADMSVDVAKGRCWVDNSTYVVNTNNETRFWPMLNDAIENVTITANASGNPRIDIIVVQMTTGTAPDGNGSNVFTIIVVEGTPAGSPSVPATPADSYKLAEVAVANGASSIVDANITDTRDQALIDISKIGGPAWASYTPDWTGATTDPTIGDGSLVGRFKKIGRTVSFSVHMQSGSTTTFGLGHWSISLPEIAASNSVEYHVTGHVIVDSGTYYPVHGIITLGVKTSATLYVSYDATSALLPMNESVPVTWASGEDWSISGTYEAAS